MLYQLSYSGPVRGGYSTTNLIRKGLFFRLCRLRFLDDFGIVDFRFGLVILVNGLFGRGLILDRADDEGQHLDARG